MAAENVVTGDHGFSFVGLTAFLGCTESGGTAPLGPGSRIGDVVIVRLVGEGGMGRVYEGLQGMPCRTVAVKVMRSGMLSEGAARRFEHEAHILGRLNHAGIARIYSAGMDRGSDGVTPYFVMEYVEDARSITAYAAERNLSTRERVLLFRSACEAVMHGHRRGVIHRDLKPGNILVDSSGQLKVIDFGVARSTDSDVSLTTLETDVGRIVGTLQYMAPEQFVGASGDLDTRVDVYSLGVVLYELLSGRLPHDVVRRPIYEVARIVQETDPPDLSTVNPRLRGDLSTIVATCLSKDRSRRYSSAAELDADLERYLRGEPIAATRPRLVDSLVRLARRHKAVTLAAMSVFAALVAGFVGVSIFAVRAEQERRVATRERERADAAGREAVEQLYVANLRALRSCVENGSLRMARQLYRRNLDIVGQSPPLEMRILAARFDDALAVIDMQGRPVDSVAYSPDGEVLGAAVFAPRTPPANKQSKAFFAHDTVLRGATAATLFFFATDGQRHAAIPTCADPWVADWRAKVCGFAGDAESTAVTLARSRDGRRTAVHCEDGRIRIVDAAADTSDVFLQNHRGRASRVALNADGTRIAAICRSGTLHIWDAVSGATVARWGSSDEKIEWLDFSPEGSRLAVASGWEKKRTLRLHDVADGRQCMAVEMVRGESPGHATPLLAISPDGRRCAIMSSAHELTIHEVATGRSLGTLTGHTAEVTAVAFSPEGTQLASGAVNGDVRLWTTDHPAFERGLAGHDGSISALAFRPDGETLASGSQDGTVRVWSRTRRSPLAVLEGLRGLTAVAFSGDGRHLVLASAGSGTVELWSPHTVERLHDLTVPGGHVTQVAFSPDGTLVAACGGDAEAEGVVRVWDTATGDILATLAGHARPTVSMAFSPDGSRLLTTCGDARMIIWDPRTGRRCMTTTIGRPGYLFPNNAVFSPDGGRIASATTDLVDATTGRVVLDLAPIGMATCQIVSPDGVTLATGVAFGTVYLTDLETGKRIRTLYGHSGWVQAIAFTSDGSRMVTGSRDGTVRLWDVATGAELRVFVGHEGGVETVIVSPDSRRLITGSTDGTARIWDIERGHELLSLPSQPDQPRAIALSPDGLCLVTAAHDGPVRIWGLSNADIMQARAPVSDRP